MGGGAAVGGGFDALLTQNQDRGFRGLFKNRRALGLACFASLGGVLYGYNQVCSTITRSPAICPYSLLQGVFGQVQVMYSFKERYTATVSFVTSFYSAFFDFPSAVDKHRHQGSFDCYSRTWCFPRCPYGWSFI